MRSEAKQKSLAAYLIVFVLITIIDSLLARFAVVAYPIAPGVAAIYFSVPFMIAFALWFGAWGAIAAYIGCFIGAGVLSGIPTGIDLYWSLADLWQVLIPLIAFRKLDADVNLKTRKDLLTFLVFGWILNNLIGACWGATTLAVGGLAPWSEVPSILISWLVTNLIVTIAITPLLLRFATPYIQRTGVYVRKYWS